MNHLKIMESLGGDRLWFDRFCAQHAAFFYYWVSTVSARFTYWFHLPSPFAPLSFFIVLSSAFSLAQLREGYVIFNLMVLITVLQFSILVLLCGGIQVLRFMFLVVVYQVLNGMFLLSPTTAYTSPSFSESMQVCFSQQDLRPLFLFLFFFFFWGLV